MTNKALIELFRAIGTHDLDAASAAALSYCKAEEKRGHRVAARELKGALNGAAGTSFAPPQVATFLSSALVRLIEPKSLESVVLHAETKKTLSLLVAEWQHSAELKKCGVAPRSKIIFHGPPGCGKSLTARALGCALGIPVFMVRFDAVIGAFLGQTAMHLRQLFDFAEKNKCVLLLDELDALGKRRGNPLDVGELDRIVISLLQELEHSHPLGLVIATTNLAENLDDALWRRFDVAIEFKRPSKDTLESFARATAKTYGIKPSLSVLRKAAATRSFAEAERVVVDEVRRELVSRSR